MYGTDLPIQEGSAIIAERKYLLKDTVAGKKVVIDTCLDDTFNRVATGLANIETPDKQEYWKGEFLWALRNGAVPAGRIMSNAGSPIKRKTSTINCTVSGPIYDSMESILQRNKEAGLTLKHGCGIGYCFSTLRPRDSYVSGAGSGTSGPLSFMEIFNATCKTIASAGGRRGAQMATFDVCHPDIIEFVRAKRGDNVLSQFNLSVLVTDAFVDAVKTDSDWLLYFPAHTHERGLPDRQYIWRHWPILDPEYQTDGNGNVLCLVYQKVRARTIWEAIMHSTYDYAEPGFILRDTVNYMNNNWWNEYIVATNPCVTGDTKIFVVGRGAVAMGDLAKSGRDVPVLAYDFEQDRPVVKIGRAPRWTGRKDVWEVTLDNGHSFKATGNHKLYRRDGSCVTVGELEIGDSLRPLRVTQGAEVKMGTNVKRHRPLYHLIAEEKFGISLSEIGRGAGFYHVHHKDGNHGNDRWGNIEVLDHGSHSSHHMTEHNPMQYWWDQASESERQAYRDKMSESTSGENNGMYGRVHSDETKAKIGKKISDRFKDPEFAEKHRKSVKGWMTPERKAHLSRIRTKDRYIEHLVCATCGGNFEVETIVGKESTRKCCSKRCSFMFTYSSTPRIPISDETRALIAASSKAYATSDAGRKSKSKAGSQTWINTTLKCGSMLIHLGHVINRNTWDRVVPAVRDKGIKAVTSQTVDKYWGTDWSDFVKESMEYNHKVVSINHVGVRDVFNITVDDVHNYMIATETEDGGYTGIVSRNCGEVPLPPHGSCLLGSVNLASFVMNPFTDPVFDWGKFEKVVRIMTRMLDNVVEINGLPLPEQRHEIEYKRRHGLGYMGLGTAMTMMKISYGSPESIAFTDEVTKRMAVIGWRVGLELAKEKGPAPIMEDEWEVTQEMLTLRPRMVVDGHQVGSRVSGKELLFGYSRYMDHIREVDSGLVEELRTHGCRFTHHTSLAPTGTIALSIGGNTSNGIEPSFSHEYLRNVNESGKKSKRQIPVQSLEYRVYKHLFPDAQVDKLPDYFVTSDDVAPRHHIDVQAAAQKWIDSSISKTINVATDTPFSEFSELYMYGIDHGLKGCTTYRYNPSAYQAPPLVKLEDLRKTMYTFHMSNGESVCVSGDTLIKYDGEEHVAANLADFLRNASL